MGEAERRTSEVPESYTFWQYYMFVRKKRKKLALSIHNISPYLQCLCLYIKYDALFLKHTVTV